MRFWLEFLLLPALCLSCLTSKNVLKAAENVFCNWNGTVDFSAYGIGLFDSTYWKCEPDSPKIIQPKFYYFTKETQNRTQKYEVISDYWTNGTEKFIRNTKFPEKLVVFTHGFVDSMNNGMTTQWTEPARASLFNLSRPPSVLEFDWSNGAEDFWNYGRAATNTQVAGRLLGKFLFEVKTENPSLKIHLVGHSLGAHVCGQAGFWLRTISKGSFEVDRIDGLDPAGPYFISDRGFKLYSKPKPSLATDLSTPNDSSSSSWSESFENFDIKAWFKDFQDQFYQDKPVQAEIFKDQAAPVASRLDPTDAKFVSVIHTNAFGFGIFENIGHLDFWPDGGRLQSGCKNFDVLDQFSKCSHRLAHDLWRVSISDRLETSYLCPKNTSTAEIGSTKCLRSPKHKNYLGFHAIQPKSKLFYYFNTSSVQGLNPRNEAEVAVRSTSIFIPFLILVSLTLSVLHCVKHRRRSLREAADADQLAVSATYAEERISLSPPVHKEET